MEFESIKSSLSKQLGASIEMLSKAIDACPDELWDTKTQFWYKAYHTLFYLDYYLTLKPEAFTPPPPFSLSEFDPDGKMPERTYTKEELLNYAKDLKKKAKDLISGLNENDLDNRWVNPYRDYSVFEILIYNMRHVQHHAGQLYMLLRQGVDMAPKWVSQS